MHTGSISPSWASLSPALVSLDLSDSKLEGQLPAAFASMQLTSLRLHNAGLAGSIPPGMAGHAAAPSSPVQSATLEA